MKNLQFNIYQYYQCGAGQRDEFGLKSLKSSLPRGVGLKSHPISASSPLRGGENLHGVKQGKASQARWDKIAIPSFDYCKFAGI